jgi:hypothetical protein
LFLFKEFLYFFLARYLSYDPCFTSTPAPPGDIAPGEPAIRGLDILVRWTLGKMRSLWLFHLGRFGLLEGGPSMVFVFKMDVCWDAMYEVCLFILRIVASGLNSSVVRLDTVYPSR